MFSFLLLGDCVGPTRDVRRADGWRRACLGQIGASAASLGDLRERLDPPAPCHEADACEAEQHHRPGSRFGDGGHRLRVTDNDVPIEDVRTQGEVVERHVDRIRADAEAVDAVAEHGLLVEDDRQAGDAEQHRVGSRIDVQARIDREPAGEDSVEREAFDGRGPDALRPPSELASECDWIVVAPRPKRLVSNPAWDSVSWRLFTVAVAWAPVAVPLAELVRIPVCRLCVTPVIPVVNAAFWLTDATVLLSS